MDAIWESLATEMELEMAEIAPRRTFVHAGVVAWKGKAILLPGNTFSGKTTLSLALCRNGATLYSDDFAVIDEEGFLRPYAKPISLRDPSGESLGRRLPRSLGLRVGKERIPVGMIVSTRFGSTSRWRPNRLSAGQGVLELMGHAAQARTRPRRTLEVLRQAVGGAVVLRGKRPEADHTARKILSACSWS